MKKDITISDISRKFMGGLDCSQVVFGYGAELQGFDEEDAIRIAAAFGGGLFQGKTCGCVTGALMALGLKYGHCELFDEEAKANMIAIKNEFEQAFIAECGSTICKDLVPFDFSQEGELHKAVESGVLLEKCPIYAKCACDIIAELLED